MIIYANRQLIWLSIRISGAIVFFFFAPEFCLSTAFCIIFMVRERILEAEDFLVMVWISGDGLVVEDVEDIGVSSRLDTFFGFAMHF